MIKQAGSLAGYMKAEKEKFSSKSFGVHLVALVVENLLASVGDLRDKDSIPGS